MGELQTFIEGTGKGKLMECEEKVERKAKLEQRVTVGEKRTSSRIGMQDYDGHSRGSEFMAQVGVESGGLWVSI